jgi:hypothetical protein
MATMAWAVGQPQRANARTRYCSLTPTARNGLDCADPLERLSD